jgi:protein-S-isoprenylcysteine O-methyltransferase Ste14
LGRVVSFVYGLVCYVAFLASFVYAVRFVTGAGVAKSLDSTPGVPLGVALLTDAGVLAVFALQHSLMARKGFKALWTKLVPEHVERSTYVLFASAALFLVCANWEPIGGTVWDAGGGSLRLALQALSFAGFGIVLVSTFLIDHFDLFGMRQVTLHLLQRPYTSPQFTARGWYGYVRHPIYAGFILAFWATPVMTVAHLVFAAMTTIYILVAIQLEERDMVRIYGARYEAYRDQVSMLVPRPRGRRRAGTALRG